MNWNLEEALTYYGRQGAPADQGALTALLRDVQDEHGGKIPGELLPAIAEHYKIKESFLLAVIKRIPSLKLALRSRYWSCAPGPTAPSGQTWPDLWKRPTAKIPRPLPCDTPAACGCAAKAPICAGTDRCTIRRMKS